MNRPTLLTAAATIAAFAAPAPALAQDDSQLWTGVSASAKLSPQFRLSADAVARFSDNRGGLYEVETSALLGYKPSETITIAGGYVHNRLYTDGLPSVLERRAREQISFDNIAQVGPGKFSARLRAEQRWREGFDGTGHRLRPFVRYSIPLRGKTALNLSHESFVNLNTTGFQKQAGWDRMRNLAAISTPLNKTISAELGYLNQRGFVRDAPDTVDHIASVSLGFSF